MRKVIGLMAIVGLLLSGCSDAGGFPGAGLAGGGDEPTATATPTSAASPAAEGRDSSTDRADERDQREEVLGTVVVDGTRYDITRVRNCLPRAVAPLERTLEVQGLGEHDGARVQIDIYRQTLHGQRLDEVSWAGPEGVYGGPESAVIDDSGGRVRGSAVPLAALHQEDAVSVEFDIALPEAPRDCD